MSMKLDLGKVFFFILLLVLSTMTAMAGNIKGTVLDKQTKEPLTGATIQITGTALGVVADIDGNYTLNVNDGTYTHYEGHDPGLRRSERAIKPCGA